MTDNVVYDNHFNGNEWFVIAIIVAGFASIWLLPRRFSPLQAVFNMLIGVVFGLMFDHAIAIPPFDLYDVGDQSQYQWFDMFSYVMYAPFGYWFIYGIERLRLQGYYLIPYILFWTALGIAVEWVSVQIGVFHYKDGYKLLYSIPVYLLLQNVHFSLYRMIFARDRHRKLKRPYRLQP